MKVSRNTSIKNNLHSIALMQNGYFTSAQAKACGYKYRNFGYYLKKGHWTNPIKGVFRLTNYPHSDDEQYTMHSLWIGIKENIPKGVYSHVTALSFHELSEVIPEKLHMTVPRNYKTSRKIPQILALHKNDLDESNIIYLRGYAVTNPSKTLLDLAQSEMIEKEHFAQSIIQALEKSLISKEFIFENKEFYPIIPYLGKNIF